MARSWLEITVTLVSGRGETYWPRPGRVFAASRSHSFFHLARAIDIAFARCNLGCLSAFDLADGTRLGSRQPGVTTPKHGGTAAKLSRLKLGERFAYEYDFGDSWTHLCEVAPHRIDPVEECGWAPTSPMPYYGWGLIPDQYGRRFDGDEGEGEIPADPRLTDLPPLRPWWGPEAADQPVTQAWTRSEDF